MHEHLHEPLVVYAICIDYLHNSPGQIMQLMHMMYALARQPLSSDCMIRLYKLHAMYTLRCRSVPHYGLAAFPSDVCVPVACCN